ncbi:transketolase [Anaplasmataceae bacterium AB001_6]|nr:transketolase [Anaplasmataceae bacterium AB001_6]
MDLHKIKYMSDAIRCLSIDAIEKSKSGHPGLPLGMSDVAAVLFSEFLKINPDNPKWIDRDRFVLSAGHGSMLLYSLLHFFGYDDYKIDALKNFRQLGSKAAGHPENICSNAIEVATGPLGQGLANAVGMAISEKLLSKKFGSDIFNHHTFVMAGDGCLMEGISHEAASFAGHLNLNKLIVLFDNNNVSIDGFVSMVSSENVLERFISYGWYVEEIDGHDYNEIYEALNNAKKSDKPSFISCKTIIGKYLGNDAGTSSAHSWPIDNSSLANFKDNIEWYTDPFIIPPKIYSYWNESILRCKKQYDKWQANLDDMDKISKQEIESCLTRNISNEVFTKLENMKNSLDNYKMDSTRKYSSIIISEIVNLIPNILGGSADLSSSNCTYVKGMIPICDIKNEDKINYIHYGIREHMMAACMNGIIAHGGFIPYVGTFFVFSDYCRPAIRMSALMKLPAIYVMTHDSIGVGEDGPTHQPIEHLASFRNMPNINVYRPANMLETIESWNMILKTTDTPSLLVLSRQKIITPIQNEVYNNRNYDLSRGAYVISDSEKYPQIILLSSGTELSIALDVQHKLLKNGIYSRVISVFCMDIFDMQSDDYKNDLLHYDDKDMIRISIEAGISSCWYKYIGFRGMHFGLEDFGLSAPSEDLFNYFGLNSQKIYHKCIDMLSSKNH